MAAAGGKRERDPARFVYVTRFGSHQCGSVLQLGGRRAEGRWNPGLEAGGGQEEPRGAAARAPDGGELPPGAGPGNLASSSAARAGLTQKTLTTKFDFPILFNEASNIMKKKKKVSVWKKVHKVISRMLEENEKYRFRLRSQQLSSEIVTELLQD